MTGPDVTVGCKFKGGRRTMDVPSPALGLCAMPGDPKVFDEHDAPQHFAKCQGAPGSRVKKFRFHRSCMNSLHHPHPPMAGPGIAPTWPEPERCGGPSRALYKPGLERESQREPWGKPSAHAPTLLC
jgi:hypothetical protein